MTDPTPAPKAALPPRPTPAPNAIQPKKKHNFFDNHVGLVVFLGSLLGSLLGVAADLGGILSTIEQIQEYFHPEIQLVGSNTILGKGLGMADEWKKQMEQEHAAKINIQDIGSLHGLDAARRGEPVDVLASSEPLTDEQVTELGQSGVEIECAAVIGYDLIIFVTDMHNKVRALSLEEIARILRGQTHSWSELDGDSRPIYILARPGSGTTDIVFHELLKQSVDQGFPVGAKYITCDTNANCLNKALALPGSLYWVSSSWLQTQPSYFRVNHIRTINGTEINPFADDINLNDYPPELVRPLFMYVLKGPASTDETQLLAKKFLSHVLGLQGQETLEKYHFYTYFRHVPKFSVKMPKGFERSETEPLKICR